MLDDSYLVASPDKTNYRASEEVALKMNRIGIEEEDKEGEGREDAKI